MKKKFCFTLPIVLITIIASCDKSEKSGSRRSSRDKDSPQHTAAQAAASTGVLRIIRFEKVKAKGIIADNIELKVTVQNTSNQPVFLCMFIRDDVEPTRELLQHRQSDPGLYGPHFLHLERTFYPNDPWETAQGYHWLPQERHPQDKRTESPPQALIPPGQMRSFSEFIPESSYGQSKFRAVIFNPAMGRIDQMEIDEPEREPAPPPDAKPQPTQEGKGTITLIVTNHKAMQVVLDRKWMNASNALNRPIRITPKGVTQVLVGTDKNNDDHWEDYNPSVSSYIPPNDLDIELYHVDPKKDGEKETLSIASFNILHQGGAVVAGDTFQMKDIPAGRYFLLAKTEVQTVENESLQFPIVSPGTNVYQHLFDHGWHLGKTGLDAKGAFEVINIYVSNDQLQACYYRPFTVRVAKRYRYIVMEGTETYVSPGENDRAFIMVCDDPEQLQRYWGILQKTGANLAQLNSLVDRARQRALQEGVNYTVDNLFLGQMMSEGLKRHALAAVITTSIFEPRKLFKADFLFETSITYGIAKLFPHAAKLASVHAAVASFVVFTAADIIVENTQIDFIRKHADTDDLELSLTYYQAQEQLEVKIQNRGVPLRNVRIRPKVAKPSFGTYTKPKEGQALKLLQTDQTDRVRYNTSLHTQAFELVYEITPHPGHLYIYTKDLESLPITKIIAPENLTKSLRIKNLTSGPGKSFGNQPTQNILAEIENAGDQKVELFIGERSGKKFDSYQIEWEQRNTPGFQMPYGLGIEARYGQNSDWTPPISMYIWVPQDKPKNTLQRITQVSIPAGQSKVFSIAMPAKNALMSANAFRVFLLDPDLKRIDEKIIAP